jgi:hypothetical protein
VLLDVLNDVLRQELLVVLCDKVESSSLLDYFLALGFVLLLKVVEASSLALGKSFA